MSVTVEIALRKAEGLWKSCCLRTQEISRHEVAVLLATGEQEKRPFTRILQWAGACWSAADAKLVTNE